MWGKVERRNAKRSSRAAPPLLGALGRVRRLSGRQQTKRAKRARTTYGGPWGLGISALVVAASVSLVVLVLRRRAERRGSPVEETTEEANEDS
jgi:hypothetical protein